MLIHRDCRCTAPDPPLTLFQIFFSFADGALRFTDRFVTGGYVKIRRATAVGFPFPLR
ncbi:hypothetical protein Y888_04925 [Mixta calida B021323]|jgi:hypothetical protein|nr:hypothetical protein Y888_04925 [Mixta calida B021323]